MPNDSRALSIVKDPVTWQYPPIEPYNRRLQVSPVHEIYFEETGDPSGKPVISCMAVPAAATLKTAWPPTVLAMFRFEKTTDASG